MNNNLWLYWECKEGTQTPEHILKCYETIKKHCKCMDIHFLNEHTVEDYLPGLYEKVKYFPQIAHKADVIRYHLLEKFGGLWLDIDTIILRNIEPLINKLNTKKVACIGYGDIFTTGFPLIGILWSTYPNSKIFTEVAKRTQMIYMERVHPNWDQVGGYLLRDVIKQYRDECYSMKFKTFFPFPITDTSIKTMALFNKTHGVDEIFRNENIYGQCLPNHILTESDLSIKDSIYNQMLEYSLK
jgi:mannosyltransferase OCH1-like enzyme